MNCSRFVVSICICISICLLAQPSFAEKIHVPLNKVKGVTITADAGHLPENTVSIYAISRTRGLRPEIKSISPDRLQAGKSHVLDIKGSNFRAGVGFYFGPDIKVKGKPRILNASASVVDVLVSDSARPGKRLIAGSRKAFTITKAISRQPSAKVAAAKSFGMPESFMMSAYKTKLWVGMNEYNNSFVGHGEVILPYSQSAAIPEQYMKAPPVLWPFKWSTNLQGVASARWDMSTIKASSGQQQSSIIKTGFTPNLPKPGQETYFAVDFTPILQPEYDKTKVKAQKQAKVSRRLPESLANNIAGRAAPKKGSPVYASLLAKQEMYAGLLQKKPENIYFMKVTPLDSKGQPIQGSSNTVKISYQRAETPSLEFMPRFTPGQREVYPTVNVLKYEPARRPSADEVAFHYMVLPNCPPLVMNAFGWKPYERVYLPPSNDRDFWDYVEDGVSAFFNFIKDLTNAVSGAWKSIKSACVNGVCLGNPTCKSLAGPALDAGLVALGIPPDIPDFSQLGDMSLDYVAKEIASEIASQSGVPVPDSVIRGKLEEARNSLKQGGGGSGAPFLVPDPDVQPRPPVLTFEVVNQDAKEISTPFILTLKFGQHGNDVFKPMEVPIPPLQPKERIKMPLLLELQPSVRYDAQQLYWTEQIGVCAFPYQNAAVSGQSCYWGGDHTIFIGGSWQHVCDGKPL